MKLTVREMAIFAMLGSLTFALKYAMQGLPNIHPVGVMVMAFTLVYRAKALYPLYIYVLLDGIFAGFATWWLPYLYVWTVLWGVTVLLPRRMPTPVQAVVYPLVCGLHGLAFGLLYAPAQALMFGLSGRAMWAWVLAGLPFDAIHGVSNLVCGLLILPLATVLRRAEAQSIR